MNYFQILGLFTTSAGIIMGGIAFVIKQYTKNLFKQQIELYRITLEHETKIKQQEHQIKFSRLDYDRTKFLKELFSQMNSIADSITLCNYEPQRIKYESMAGNTIQDFKNSQSLFSKNLILIDDDLIEISNSFYQKSLSLIRKIEENRLNEFDGNKENVAKNKEEYSKEISILRHNNLNEIKIRFRKVMTL